ncbi:magnesium transporter CorA family protein [Levilactobacillus bambusae]|uniref:Magnesium transporter CorA n=1 Tax=Levilactobacillus bambusae TaxID=2024736 RepID=A0A2V1N0G1_9LACO|nr:magnesium transporter CorA family protein [Levilactobacillus bambusae]PWG00228.1 hypothetical protein DCM90_04650 [Levilactobacillus bambusae]
MLQIHHLSQISDQAVWVEAQTPTDDEVKELKSFYGLSQEILGYALDKNERTNYDYDFFNKSELFVYHVPYQVDSTHLRYVTRPISLIYQSPYLFTFNMQDIPLVNRDLETLLKNSMVKSYQSFILLALLKLSDEFLPAIEQINATRNRLDRTLNQRPTNDNFQSLSHLEQSLAYFTSATANNETLLKAVPKSHFGKDLDQQGQEHLDDVLVEAGQVAQMTATEMDVIDRISSTFNNVLNNNLNGTMKFMTVWSLVLAIPTIVTGFFGMNVKLPFENFNLAWILVCALSVFFIVWMIWVFRRRNMM